MLPILKKFGKAALAIELTTFCGIYYIFHDINTGGQEARQKWDDRVGYWLIDAFYKVTGDNKRVIEHRENNSDSGDRKE